MKRVLFILLCVLMFAVPAFAGSGQGQTPLAVTVSGSAECQPDGSANVTLTFVVTSGNASGASLEWSFGPVSGATTNSGAITINPGFTTDDPAGDWTAAPSGPVKTYTGTVTITGVMPGTYDASATVNQAGGNYDTVSGSDDAIYVQSCQAVNTCDQFSKVFGQVTNNKNLSKNVTPVNIQFKGAFGDVATLTISPANSSTVVLPATSVSRNGDSCVYNYQWIPTNLAAGTYTATVTGNGQQPLTFSFSISYKK